MSYQSVIEQFKSTFINHGFESRQIFNQVDDQVVSMGKREKCMCCKKTTKADGIIKKIMYRKLELSWKCLY